jgi:Leucine-rich repeat (LRR) protein
VSLDLSHNTITEVKPNLLHNLGLLTSLSLAHNKLHSLDAKALGPPPLLTQLQLQSNALKIFPTQVLSRAPLSLINLESNRLRHYPMEFIPKVQNGSRILTNENPLACDCTLVFLRRYFQTERPELSNFSTPFFTDYDNFQCTLSGNEVSKLAEVPESQLMCDYSNDPLAEMVKLPEDLDVDIRSWNQQGNTGQLR